MLESTVLILQTITMFVTAQLRTGFHTKCTGIFMTFVPIIMYLSPAEENVSDS
jgi:hypothetical protein